MRPEALPLDKPIQIFVGAYGSGKTEVAVNFTFQARSRGLAVTIADLDLVNPYFRSRELRAAFESRGIRVLAPGGELANADLPVIIPQIRGSLGRSEGVLVLDVGGDDAGSRALSQFAPFILDDEYAMYLVVNNRRPWTGTPAGIREVIARVERASRLRVTALVSNPNLGDETDPDVVRSGHAAIRLAAGDLGLRVAFLAVASDVRVAAAGKMPDDVPHLVLERHLFPPWYEDPLRFAPYHDRRSHVLLQARLDREREAAAANAPEVNGLRSNDRAEGEEITEKEDLSDGKLD